MERLGAVLSSVEVWIRAILGCCGLGSSSFAFRKLPRAVFGLPESCSELTGGHRGLLVLIQGWELFGVHRGLCLELTGSCLELTEGYSEVTEGCWGSPRSVAYSGFLCADRELF